MNEPETPIKTVREFDRLQYLECEITGHDWQPSNYTHADQPVIDEQCTKCGLHR